MFENRKFRYHGHKEHTLHSFHPFNNSPFKLNTFKDIFIIEIPRKNGDVVQRSLSYMHSRNVEQTQQNIHHLNFSLVTLITQVIISVLFHLLLQQMMSAGIYICIRKVTSEQMLLPLSLSSSWSSPSSCYSVCYHFTTVEYN